MPAGRPTDYRPEFCKIVIECGREGKSLVQMAVACDVIKETMLEWAKVHPEFTDALGKAKQLSQQWWENLAQNHMVEENGGPKVNAGLWSRSMAARFPNDYREKQEIKQDTTVTFLTKIEAAPNEANG